MVVHVYNPSHDEALAINKAQYCPSSAARRTASMYWDVAKYWAAPGDCIVQLPADGSLRGVSVPDWAKVAAIEPWGWDRHIVGVLRRLGAPDRLLPTEDQLDAIRELSSRRTAVRVVEALGRNINIDESLVDADESAGGAILSVANRWCTTEEAVLTAVADYGGIAMLKQPWSCSGRGVWRSDSPSSPQRIRKTLREQGGVEVEPLYERIADFAMEFFIDCDGNVAYEGLSFFETHDGGGYAGNLVAPQDELRRRIEGLAPPALLDAEGHLPLDFLADRLCGVLACILRPYSSVLSPLSLPLGVDMMLTPHGIHPCIEVNLRNTMGRVAIFQQRSAEQNCAFGA